MSASHSLNTKTVAGLAIDYQFEFIPDSPAATAAGYTAADRALAQVWYSPLIDGDRFYYAAWSGSILDSQNHKSSIFVCRKRKDGALVFAVNCHDYQLDTAPNFLGDNTVICRVRPLILGSTIYLCNAVMSNIGPQLYAVDKKTGNLKWACSYYLPLEQAGLITTKGDYSQFVGSNMRVSDLCPVGVYYPREDSKHGKNGKCRKIIYLGTSSFQNVFNVGLIGGNFPIYTDQGYLFAIEDLGFKPKLLWRTPTCAPLVAVGDVLTQGGPPELDAFVPGQDYVIIKSLSAAENIFVQAYFFPTPPAPGLPNTTPIIGAFTFDSQTVITEASVQPVWAQPGVVIYQGADRETAYTLASLIALWQTEQATLPPGQQVTRYFWSFITPEQVDVARGDLLNQRILFFKQFFSGQTVEFAYDAQSLNYWGNSTWGGPPVFDFDNDLIHFGTGQAHDIPIGETLLLSQPQYNFRDLKEPVIDIIYRYIAGTADLESVNRAKEIFTSQVLAVALDLQLKSPRGRMSYSVGMLASKLRNGELAYATNHIAWDTYSFLADEPQLLVFPAHNSIDGDVSSGPVIWETKRGKWVATAAKSGLSLTLDISNYNPKVRFDHNNLAAVGVEPLPLVFDGPNGALGGSNYLDASVDGTLISSQGNMSWFAGSTGSSGQLEIQVTADGKVVPINNSYATATDIVTGEHKWTTPYGTRAHAQVLTYGHIVFSEDGSGSLYALDSRSGEIIWKFDAKPYGVNGGIVAPQVASDGQVLWMNNYVAFGIIGAPGANGISLRVDPDLLVTGCSTYGNILAGRTFVSWDTYPKRIFDNPARAPENVVTITHNWQTGKTLEAFHSSTDPPYAFQVILEVRKFDPCTGLVTFKRLPTGGLQYQYVRLINSQTYELKYVFEGVESTAWLKLEV